jgi:hypothetical protein
LAGDEALRNALAAAARKTVETWFDWAMLMPRYADLWREQVERVTHTRERAEGRASFRTTASAMPLARRCWQWLASVWTV